MPETLTIGSLFSGYGGLDMAVEAVTGATPAWFVEYDKAPSKILAHHWPDVPNYGDVTKVDWETMPPVDIITGGSPCQDLSAAGRRAGMTEGTRSNLWVNMREAIRIIRPRLVVWENVQGALSAKAASDSDLEPGARPMGNQPGGNLRALGRVLGDLAEIGYDAQWTTLRASDVGAPHHRARVFLIAYPSDSEGERWGEGAEQPIAGPPEVTAAVGGDAPAVDAASVERERRESGVARRGDAAVGREAGNRTDRLAEDATDSQGVGPGGCLKSCIAGVRPAVGGGRQGTPADAGGAAVGEHAGESPAEETGPGGSHGSGDPRGERPAEIGREGAADAGSEECARRAGLRAEGEEEVGRRRPGHCHNENVDFGPYAPAVRRWERLTRPAPDPTELNRNGKPRLNAGFAEWMMGLPEGHVTQVPGISRADQLKAIGNGVCPQQAAAAIHQLLTSPAPAGHFS